MQAHFQSFYLLSLISEVSHRPHKIAHSVLKVCIIFSHNRHRLAPESYSYGKHIHIEIRPRISRKKIANMDGQGDDRYD